MYDNNLSHHILLYFQLLSSTDEETYLPDEVRLLNNASKNFFSHSLLIKQYDHLYKFTHLM